MALALLSTIHLALAAAWCGSMGYSLVVIQPKALRFFTDDDQLEDFLLVLAHGNRWKVVPLIAALLLTGAGIVLLGGGPAFVAVLALYCLAAAIFVNVSWWHWPARVFALPAERPAFRLALRRRAWAMTVLVGAAFLTGLATTSGLM